MTTSIKALATAAREIGYNRWNDPLQGTKYGRWYASMGMGAYFGHSGVPYCNMFTSWVLHQIGVKEPGPGRYAYTPYCLRDYRNIGRGVPVRSARPGDLVFFDWNGDGVVDHVGFVEKVFSWGLQTIEGNTSPGTAGSQSNGGGVYRRTRSWSGGVHSVVRPQYSNDPSTGNLAVDGFWGADTTRRLQEVLGTPEDGQVSSQSSHWRSRNPGLTSGWQWTSKPVGSLLIAEMQRRLGVKDDGLIGTSTIDALSKRYGIKGDGKLDRESLTIKALQRALNRGTF